MKDFFALIGLLAGLFVVGCQAKFLAEGVARENSIADFQESRRQARIASGECVHTGFTGKYGTIKVYNCGSQVLKEHDL